MNKKLVAVVVFLILLIFFIFVYNIPSLHLNGGDVDLLLNEEYKEPGYNANALYRDITSKVSTSNNIDNNKIGNYYVNYHYNFLFNHNKRRNVKVYENISPIINLNGNDNITMCPNNKYEEEGFTSIDNYDGDITSSVNAELMDDGILYTSTDASGNTTTKKRIIKYEDHDAPVITLNGDSSKTIYVGSTYNEPGYMATDNCLGDITDKVEVIGSVDTSKVGLNTINYKVSDDNNETIVTRNIYVINKSYPSSETGKPGTIYLTFDDGPNNTYTPIILDVLKKYNAKATFFIVPKGNTTNNLILREHNEGHTVGIHSYSHVYSNIYSSDQALIDDINRVNDKIHSITGIYSYIYRYPGGSSNTVSSNYSSGIISRTSSALHSMGFHYFDWNISSGDASNVTPSSNVIANNVISHLSKSRANVVLMHDIKHNTAYAIESILEYGISHGYSFEAITLSTPEVHHSINN